MSYNFNLKLIRKEFKFKKCINSFNKSGFCVIENAIPSSKIPYIRDEVILAQKKINQNIKNIKKLLSFKKYTENQLLKNPTIKLRSVGRNGYVAKPVNDIVFMPKFSEYLASPVLLKLARKLLDDHIRIAQLHPKFVYKSNKNDAALIENDKFGLSRMHKGSSDYRDYHTDWPHDLSSYGGGDPNENIGAIRQPFPDITMCLVMIFYLTDVDERSGGTFAVPGSHKDHRNPRGPSDKITLTAPIPGEIQIKAKAGSVFIQDSRLWHSSPMHNFGHNDRIAIVSRWCPWWLTVNDFARKSRFNVVCRPLSYREFLALPKKLQPLMTHLCSEKIDTIQKPLLERSKKAANRTKWAHQQVKKNSTNLIRANSNISINID